ncbi:hypothetical protein [Kitasatospora sp. NPDC087315]|uniref:hypothetical protein n=1 Tax=Kitasatospora sp. NPDC087315 TaxID=3364069 RepID=UPI0038216C56
MPRFPIAWASPVRGQGRNRLGLTSHHPLGRAFAGAVPLAAVLAETYAAGRLWGAFRLATDPDSAAISIYPAEFDGPLVAAAATLVPPVLTAGAVLANRWSAARILALVTMVVVPLVRVLALPGLLGMPADIALSFSLDLPDLWLPVLNALLLLIAPPGRTHPRSAVPWALTVAIITGASPSPSRAASPHSHSSPRSSPAPPSPVRPAPRAARHWPRSFWPRHRSSRPSSSAAASRPRTCNC